MHMHIVLIFCRKIIQTGEGKSTEEEQNTEKETDAGASEKLPSDKNSASNEEPAITNNPTVVEDMFAHRNAICIPFRRLSSARWLQASSALC